MKLQLLLLLTVLSNYLLIDGAPTDIKFKELSRKNEKKSSWCGVKDGKKSNSSRSEQFTVMKVPPWKKSNVTWM